LSVAAVEVTEDAAPVTVAGATLPGRGLMMIDIVPGSNRVESTLSVYAGSGQLILQLDHVGGVVGARSAALSSESSMKNCPCRYSLLWASTVGAVKETAPRVRWTAPGEPYPATKLVIVGHNAVLSNWER
jgi:hypothetical protein